MKHLKIFTSFAVVLSMLFSLSACSDNNDEPMPDMFMAFATLESLTDDTCVFSVQESENSDPIRLIASVKLNASNFTIGNRYVIQYSTPDNKPFTAGPITLYIIVNPFTGDVTEMSLEDIKTITTDPLNVMYVSRTGNWLNMQAYAVLASTPQLFGLYVDDSTLDSEWPELYIGFRSDNNSSLQQAPLYGSFNISSILNLPNAKGFKLHYKYNGVNQVKEFENGRKSFEN